VPQDDRKGTLRVFAGQGVCICLISASGSSP
jgi:hypothetical protein